MKKFRVWAYETSGYYKEVEAENKKEADELVYPHGIRDETWIEGNDGESDFIINKDNTEHEHRGYSGVRTHSSHNGKTTNLINVRSTGITDETTTWAIRSLGGERWIGGWGRGMDE